MMEPEDFQLQEPTSAEPFLSQPNPPLWLTILIGVVIGLIVGLIIHFLLRKKPATPPDLRRREDAAYMKAVEAIEKAIEEEDSHSTTLGLSEALRTYLAVVRGDPSLYETHEEFVARHAALDGLPDDVRKAVSKHFDELARLKYGKHRTADRDSLAEESRSLLDNLHREAFT